MYRRFVEQVLYLAYGDCCGAADLIGAPRGKALSQDALLELSDGTLAQALSQALSQELSQALSQELSQELSKAQLVEDLSENTHKQTHSMWPHDNNKTMNKALT